MTDQEINSLVARKLGWHDFINHGKKAIPPILVDSGFCEQYVDVPDYCRSIEAAWEIVQNLASEAERKECGPILRLEHDGKWHFRIGNDVSQADTAPMAICRAFLKMEK